MRYINYVYEQDLKGVKEIDLSERGKFSYYKGKSLELIVYQIMSRFNNEIIEGNYFGKENDVTATSLIGITEIYTKAETSRLYQIDVYGKTYDGLGIWLCECKNRETKLGMADVKKLEAAKEAFLMQERQLRQPQDASKIKLWYVSTRGFTAEAIEYLKGIENSYYSDHESINYIYKKYGGGFNVPIFDN